MTGTPALPTCYVVQGVGLKTDFASGRTINLDASYAVIRDAVADAGLRCVRFDEVASFPEDPVHLEWLYRADVVIVDLSTDNLDAVYALGLRFGLRPRSTIVIAENAFRSPYDLDPVSILRYEHLGPDIGVNEASRFRSLLAATITGTRLKNAVDSPVYRFLSLHEPGEGPGLPGPGATAAPPVGRAPTTKDPMEQARSAMRRGDFLVALPHLEAARASRPDDTRVIQQLALATYKSKVPDAVTALLSARTILTVLDPERTNDPETLGLWGAIHKRLWEHTSDPGNLDAAIAAYERGFVLTQDHYNGINVAYLLDVRAALERPAELPGERIADAVTARRVRRDVTRLCQLALGAERTTGRFSGESPAEMRFGTAADDASRAPAEERFWIIATLLEAAVGLGDQPAADQWRALLHSEAAPEWMLASTNDQIARLQALLAESPLKGA